MRETINATNRSLSSVLEEVSKRGWDPALVIIQYEGCGTHSVELEQITAEELRYRETWGKR